MYKGFDAEMETWDEDEEDRLEHLALAKQRGKGAPKKKRSAEGEFAFPDGFLELGIRGNGLMRWAESKKMKGKRKPAVAAAVPKE